MEGAQDPIEAIGRPNETTPSSVGTLVSQKLDMELVHDSYAGADPPDPTYTAKTANLVKTCPTLRAVRGDGSCGFRGMMFAYFELLISLAEKDPSVLQKERARIDGLTAMLHRSDYSALVWEEWVECTLELFDALMHDLPKRQAMATLEEAFNDEEKAPALVQHFRILTSSYMHENPSDYIPYVPDQNVDQYRHARIDPAAAEMEETSLKCAYDMLLDDAGIVLEIFYLDRSAGERVNTFEYEPKAAEKLEPDAKTGLPKIRLLYRPGHYDILYAPAAAEMRSATETAPEADGTVAAQETDANGAVPKANANGAPEA